MIVEILAMLSYDHGLGLEGMSVRRKPRVILFLSLLLRVAKLLKTACKLSMETHLRHWNTRTLIDSLPPVMENSLLYDPFCSPSLVYIIAHFFILPFFSSSFFLISVWLCLSFRSNIWNRRKKLEGLFWLTDLEDKKNRCLRVETEDQKKNPQGTELKRLLVSFVFYFRSLQ